ncbi:MAG: DinB family protein [Candidatus Kapabacteria bacterium]|jgi:hypothetical protein|nr:DinB family protein [Candidatus Kapabacteria bacterium]
MNKDQIFSELLPRYQHFSETVSGLPEADFLYAAPGKWSSAQQLDHVRKSVKPLVLALRLPKFVLKLFFGTANRPSKSYDELVQKYQSKLKQALTPPAAFRPETIAFQNRTELSKNVIQTVHRLTKALETWSEEDLDRYILPHPLLGKITVREMMYFTIYHAEHHEKLVQFYLAERPKAS